MTRVVNVPWLDLVSFETAEEDAEITLDRIASTISGLQSIANMIEKRILPVGDLDATALDEDELLANKNFYAAMRIVSTVIMFIDSLTEDLEKIIAAMSSGAFDSAYALSLIERLNGLTDKIRRAL